MSEEKSSTNSGGIGILGLLGVVFVTLKLCGVINWSWWFVVAPFYVPLLIIVSITITLWSSVGIYLLYKRFTK